MKQTKQKIILFFLLFALAFVLFKNYQEKQQPPLLIDETILKLSSKDRIIILAPHPDDEILACGGIIQKTLSKKIPIKIVFLTYGDNNQWSFLTYKKHFVFMPKSVQTMGLVRYQEAVNAAQKLGVKKENLIFLGYPDFRTMDIWLSHWGKNRPPIKGILTKAKQVPYQNAYRPQASYKGEDILEDIANIIQEFKPTKIFVSHPADHNLDHRALYLFTRVALWNLEDTLKLKPKIYPYPIHFQKWPQPPGHHPNIDLTPPDILKDQILWKFHSLTPQEMNKKEKALKRHTSQYNSSKKYLLSFVRPNELFGDFKDVALSEKKQDILSPDGELLFKQRVSFVGIKGIYTKIDDGNIIFTIHLSRPLGKNVGIGLSLFGYKKNTSFVAMPKIRIRFGSLRYKITDQNKRLSVRSVELKRKAKTITLRIPLSLLKNPDYILTSINTYFGGALSLDWPVWRVLNLKP